MQALSIIQKEGNPGNNILPRLPDLQRVFNDPVIKGALESVLGSNDTMQPNRHSHLTSPGSKAQQWHKDSFFGYRKPLRHHQLRYVMVMYYPQDTIMEMGPTGIKPGTHYDVMDPKDYRGSKTLENTHAKDDAIRDKYVVCKAGTLVLIHYDIVHRSTANTSKDSHRLMFKFQFNRLDEPTKPTWNHDPTKTIYDAANAGLLQPIVKHVWSWMLGLVEVPKEVVADKEIATWKSSLDNRNGHICLNAAYNLALCHEYDVLIGRLYDSEQIFRSEAAYASTACRCSRAAITRLHETLRKEKNSGQVAYCIAFILSEMGTPPLDVLPSLVNIAQTRDP